MLKLNQNDMSTNKINPFPTTGYLGKDYFCDREYELFTLGRQVENKSKFRVSGNKNYMMSFYPSGWHSHFNWNTQNRY